MGCFPGISLPLGHQHKGEAFGLAATGAPGCNKNSRPPRVTLCSLQMAAISICRDRVLRRWIRRRQKRWLDPMILQLRSSLPRSCSELHSGAVLVYHFGEWLAVLPVSRAPTSGLCVRESKYKADGRAQRFTQSATAC